MFGMDDPNQINDTIGMVWKYSKAEETNVRSCYNQYKVSNQKYIVSLDKKERHLQRFQRQKLFLRCHADSYKNSTGMRYNFVHKRYTHTSSLAQVAAKMTLKVAPFPAQLFI